MVIVFAAARRMAGFAISTAKSDAGASALGVIEPRLLLSPTEAEFAALCPADAWTGWEDSRSVLVGRVGYDQILKDFQVVEETADGAGFSQAVLDSVRYWRFSPQAVDGQPTSDGVIKLTAVWMALPQARVIPSRLSLASWRRAPI